MLFKIDCDSRFFYGCFDCNLSYRILDDKLDTMLKKIEVPELLKSKE